MGNDLIGLGNEAREECTLDGSSTTLDDRGFFCKMKMHEIVQNAVIFNLSETTMTCYYNFKLLFIVFARLNYINNRQ